MLHELQRWEKYTYCVGNREFFIIMTCVYMNCNGVFLGGNILYLQSAHYVQRCVEHEIVEKENVPEMVYVP